MPGRGTVVPVPVSPLSPRYISGEQVPLDGVSKVAKRRRAGGKSWPRGLPGLPVLRLTTNRE